MKRWRYILWSGIILGMIVDVIDFWVKDIPYMISIPLGIIAISLIFAGVIMRKKKMSEEQ